MPFYVRLGKSKAVHGAFRGGDFALYLYLIIKHCNKKAIFSWLRNIYSDFILLFVAPNMDTPASNINKLSTLKMGH